MAKATIFLSVIVISLLVSKPKRLDLAGIYAIFCTQSNDFALGYPIGKLLCGQWWHTSTCFIMMAAQK